MGWEQVVFPLTSFSECQGTIVNFDCCENRYSRYSSNTQQLIDFIDQYVSGSFLDTANIAKDSRTTIYEKDGYILQIAPYDVRTGYAGPGIELYFEFPDGSEHVRLRNDGRYSQTNKVYAKIALAINEDTSQGVCVIGSYTESYSTSVNPSEPSPSQTTYTRLYEWITNAKPGPPKPQGDATCEVTYFLPDDEYAYSKITFKEDTPPIDMNDGYVQDILASQSSVNIENLVEGQKYYFTIFTDKSESESFSYIVGEVPIPPEPEIGYVLFKDGNFKYPTIFTIQNPYVVSSGLTETGHCSMDIQNDCIHFHLDKTGNPYQESNAHYYVMFNGNNTKLSYTKSPYTISNTTYAKRFINTLKATVSGSASIKASWTGSGTANTPILSSTIAVSNSREISGVTNSRYLCIIRPDNIDETKTWNLDNAEIELQYVDEQVANGGSLYPPALSFSIDATNKFNYSTLDTEHIDLYVNNIILKLDKHLRPYKDDTFLIYSEDDAASNEWTIEQLMNEVKKINYNSFILRPIWNSAFTVLPFNLPGGNQLVTKRDKYIGSGISTNSTIAIENAFDNVNSLPTYLSLNISSHQLKRSTNKYSDPSLADIPIISNYNTKYPNPVSIGSNSATPGCVLYTDAQYDEYYINDMLIY